jgi:hypothetical protein
MGSSISRAFEERQRGDVQRNPEAGRVGEGSVIKREVRHYDVVAVVEQGLSMCLAQRFGGNWTSAFHHRPLNERLEQFMAWRPIVSPTLRLESLEPSAGCSIRSFIQEWGRR